MYLVHDDDEYVEAAHVGGPDTITGARAGRGLAAERPRLHVHQDQSIPAHAVRRRRAPLGRLESLTSKELVHERVDG